MIAERAFIAACASCMTSLTLYPLDTAKTALQLGKPFPPLTHRIYAGAIPDAIGTFAATGTYFLAYENSLLFISGAQRVPLASLIGISFSGLVITPTDVIKRRAQVSRNSIDYVRKFTFDALKRTYILGLLKNAPKIVVKSVVYEILVNSLKRHFKLDIAGALSAMAATIVVITFFTPLDVIKTYASLEKPIDKKINMYRGFLLSLIQSMIGNGIGYYFIEHFAPRK